MKYQKDDENKTKIDVFRLSTDLFNQGRLFFVVL